MYRRLAHVIFAVCIICAFSSGCSPDGSSSGSSGTESSRAATDSTTAPRDSSAKEELVFKLAYNSKDSLDPFTASTHANQLLTPLLYEGLTYMDGEWTPQLRLAESVTQEGGEGEPRVLRVTLRGNAKFSDGSAVTADDVKKSFSLAKASVRYKAQLSNIQSVESDGKQSLVFKLTRSEPNAYACLSFPIIKRQKDKDAVPLGSGRYQFSSGDTPKLTVNTKSGQTSKTREILLENTSDGDQLIYTLENNFISYYFTDLQTGSVPRVTGAHSAVPLNQMVFIGINEKREPLSDAEIRQAVSLCIDRSAVVSSAFGGRARAATGVFHPSWKPASALSFIGTEGKIEAAVAQLDKKGYNRKKGNFLELEMLVASGNGFRDSAAGMLVSQMEQAGIRLTVTALPLSKMKERLKKGNFDLYLGELRMNAGMSLDPWFVSGGEASYGILSEEVKSAYESFVSGQSDIQAFYGAFEKQIPFIPLCWRDGIAAYCRSLSGVSPMAFDSFYGIENWIMGGTGS